MDRRAVYETWFDKESIMLYQFDGSLFTDVVGTQLNMTLSNLDEL